jgi:DNA-binding transcriptional MerR regulator
VVKSIYLIKDVARLSGLSIYTVKYYLKLGLLKEVGRSPETNFRYFDDSSIEVLERIKAYRKDGISLKKIRELLSSEV